MPRRKSTTVKRKKRRVKSAIDLLTAEDKRLLEYPPNPDTWRCNTILAVNALGINIYCRMCNSGKYEKCVICGTPREKGEILWPKYATLCKKLNLDPGVHRFKISESGLPITRTKLTGWKPWENLSKTN